MKLSPPKVVTWWVCFVLGAVSLLLMFHVIAIPSLPALWVTWMPVVGLVIMLLATVLPGL